MRLCKPALVAGAVVLLALVVGVGWWARRQARCEACTIVPGGDGGAWPVASPDAERLVPEAAARAADYARQRGATLLVARHGHVIVAVQPHGAEAEWRLASTALFAPLPELFGRGGDAVGSLSRELWQPLNAADARLRCAAQTELRGCRLWARPADWLRVGQLLLDQGRFEGAQVVDQARLTRVIDAGSAAAGSFVAARAARGMEPLVDARGLMLRGEGRTRLWLAPSVALVVLLVDEHAADARDDETELPNLLIRGLLDRPQAHAVEADAAGNGVAGDAAQLAPGH